MNREAVVDQTGDVSGCKELGQLSVCGHQTTLSGQCEQFGIQHAGKQSQVHSGHTLQSRMIRVGPGAGECDPRLPGQEEDRAEVAGSIQQRCEVRSAATRDLVLGILLGDELAAGHVECLGPRARPWVVCDRRRQHLQVERIAEQAVDSTFPSSVYESLRIFVAEIPVENVEHPLFRKRIQPQDPEITTGSDRL